VNERATICVTRPAVPPSLQPLYKMLIFRHSVPDSKGKIYLGAINWRLAVPDCGQWVVLCEAVQVGYCAAEVKTLYSAVQLILCEAVQVGYCAAQVKGCVLRCTGGSVWLFR
jgi:hypothetical protein